MSNSYAYKYLEFANLQQQQKSIYLSFQKTISIIFDINNYLFSYQIIPPKQQYTPVSVADDFNLNCVSQMVSKLGETNLLHMPFSRSKKIKLKDFESMAKQFDPSHVSLDELEAKLWNDLSVNTASKKEIPIYAIDNELSLFSPSYTTWNLNKFEGGSILTGKEMKGNKT